MGGALILSEDEQGVVQFRTMMMRVFLGGVLRIHLEVMGWISILHIVFSLIRQICVSCLGLVYFLAAKHATILGLLSLP